MSAELEEKVKELERRVEELEDTVSGVIVNPNESDMESFIRTVSPGIHVERAVAIGYFLVHEEGWNPFTVEYVENAYEACRTPRPANLSDVLAGAEGNGWLMRAGTKGRNQLWTITQEGDAAVKSGFER